MKKIIIPMLVLTAWATSLSAQVMREQADANYMRFYNFKKQLQLADRNWTQLDETEISYLQTITEATNGRSASMAQGVLCFFFDICYEDKIEEGGEVIPPTKNMTTETQLSDNQIQNLNYELSLYPNPTSSEITVTLNNPAVKIVEMAVYDIYGKNVSLQTVNQSYSTLKMSELAQGIYILKVWLDQGDVVMRKVVKQ
ncbi:MAG: T9SS type A sorting domain-containing protein [Bacteroidales bacterium]|nr:T9SS type A sorting domain-containing protein [Bacteroidales bacterium]